VRPRGYILKDSLCFLFPRLQECHSGLLLAEERRSRCLSIDHSREQVDHRFHSAAEGVPLSHGNHRHLLRLRGRGLFGSDGSNDHKVMEGALRISERLPQVFDLRKAHESTFQKVVNSQGVFLGQELIRFTSSSK
jgi:hypothetical protein